MSFAINIYNDLSFSEPLEVLRLGATLLEEDSAGQGAPNQLFVRNEGETTIVLANINLGGPGADRIQLSRDEAGAHGVWAQPGEGIVAVTNEVAPGDVFSFWARGVFTEDDAPEIKPFSFDLEMVGRA